MPNYNYYKRNLPHKLPPGASLFLTMRLAGSLPQAALELLRLQTANAELAALRSGYAGEHSYARQKRYFGRFDALLDGSESGATWLRHPAVAAIVTASIHHFLDESNCQLICYCVMPNHLHLVVVLADEETGMMRRLQRFKSHTAIHSNRCLNKTGQFWHRETYDHVIRDAAEMQRVVAYVVNNPVKAGLVKEWQHWPHTYSATVGCTAKRQLRESLPGSAAGPWQPLNRFG